MITINLFDDDLEMMLDSARKIFWALSSLNLPWDKFSTSMG